MFVWAASAAPNLAVGVHLLAGHVGVVLLIAPGGFVQIV